MRISSVLLAAAFLAVAVTALPHNWGGRRRGGFVQLSNLESDRVDTSNADSVMSGKARINQRIDHFNVSDGRTFLQYYFFNNEHNADKKSNVNILYLSGEQTASVNMITGMQPITQYADKFHANLYALEHRYYGESRPFADTSTDNLKFLSSQQAVEDVAEFIKAINYNSGAPDAQKWVVVGGSYAGALAAWARLKHPELIAGSVASSAPILAQLDFYGYLETVDKNVAKIPKCFDQLKDGIQRISDAFESEAGRNMLDAKFPVSPKLSTYADLQDNDIVQFFAWVTDVFEGASQYASPASVENVCKEFTKNVDTPGYNVLDALAGLLTTYNGKDFTFDVNYTAAIEDMSDTRYSDLSCYTDCTDFTGRLWTYQTCTEFGYFQSTDRGSNLFQATVPVNIFLDLCKDVFDIDVDDVKKAVDATNAYYGERDYFMGTNVVFAHGTVDPWTYLTKQMGTSQHWSVVVAEIEGGTHCSDLNRACDSNGNNCNAARQQVQALTQMNIDQWLNGPFSVPDSINITDNVGNRPIWYDPILPPPLSVLQNGPTDVVANNRAKRSVRSVSGSGKKEKKSRIGRGSGWNQFTGKNSRRNRQPPSLGQNKFLAVEARIDQPWNHFNPNDERQFKQRIFFNDLYVKADGNGNKLMDAPNFLMIGGEGAESDSWLIYDGLAWMTYAKEVNANLYILEHRYYGASKLNTNDLQYLTSAQMLYDVARFIKIVQRDRNQTGPWITFGGSYAGALSAWSREWFPELIIGAVASSGPVLAKTDFFEYLQVVENVLRASSQKCADRTQDAFDQLRKMTHDAAGRAQISKKFNVVPAWSDNAAEVVPQVNIQNVFAILYGVFQDVVQYSDDNNLAGDYTVGQLCAIMEDDVKYPNSLDAVRYVQQWVYDDFGNPETGSDPYEDFALLRDMMKYIDGHANIDSGMRPYSDDDLASVLWTWQTCNELGSYYTTDYGEGIFGNPVPLNFFVLMCEQVFGVTMDHIEKGVARSNYQYGGRARYSATNVVLPNGNHDPWHALGLLEQGTMDDSVVPIVIEGTAHCADMYAARTSDPPQLTAARATILANIKQWLNVIPETETTTPVPTTAAQTTTQPTTQPARTTSQAPTQTPEDPIVETTPSAPEAATDEATEDPVTDAAEITTQTPSTPPTTTSAGRVFSAVAMLAPLVAVLIL